MIWIKINMAVGSHPQTREKVLFVVSPHYAGGEIHKGIFVLNYENEYANHGAVFIGDDKAFVSASIVDHYLSISSIPLPPNTQ